MGDQFEYNILDQKNYKSNKNGFLLWILKRPKVYFKNDLIWFIWTCILCYTAKILLLFYYTNILFGSFKSVNRLMYHLLSVQPSV